MYFNKIKNVYSAFREELGENIPIIFGEISEKIDFSRWNMTLDTVKEINAGYRKLLDEIPNTRLVSQDGLGIQFDGIHFCAKSLRVFGVRYFMAYKDFLTK